MISITSRLVKNHIEDRMLIKNHKFGLFSNQNEGNYKGKFSLIAQLYKEIR